jgi:hypothetical protein
MRRCGPGDRKPRLNRSLAREPRCATVPTEVFGRLRAMQQLSRATQIRGSEIRGTVRFGLRDQVARIRECGLGIGHLRAGCDPDDHDRADDRCVPAVARAVARA